jgi:uncharacterized protein (TIGR00255 family)
MKSMTGHGRGEAVQRGYKVTVEISSVNRKQSDLSLSLPDELEPLEAQVREEILKLVARGRLLVRVKLHAGESAAARARINDVLAKAYAKELRRVAKDLKLAGEVSLDHLLRAPGVLESTAEAEDAQEFWPTVKKALDQALAGLNAMRGKEGAHLAADLRARLNILRKAAGEIGQQAPQVAERYRLQLHERIKGAGLEGLAPDDERLLKEVALFADRSDISEELTRLASHFKQFDDLLKSPEPVGRTLDFLTQEMNREINTIGSKANDAVISRQVVVAKSELEKLREQIQNVE